MKLPENWIQACVETHYGAMGIRFENNKIAELIYLPSYTEIELSEETLTQACHQQIHRYLEDPTFKFNLPIADKGTEFQKKVWQAIAQIPCGEVRTYGEIAKFIGSAPRAVGQACGANPFPLIVPCHRVVASNGIGGFAHHSLEGGFHHRVKVWLLKHEGAI